MNKIRVGIIGTGFGTIVQAPGFMMHPAYTVVALSGVARPGRAKEQASALGIPHAYDDYREMLRQEELDLVSVVSAPDLHHAMTMAALERGIPVLCEKPMAFNQTEAQAMLETAEQRGLANAINFEFRHIPIRTRFKELIDEGYLGDLIHFNLTHSMGGYTQNLNRPMGWLWREENGGGMLGAIGSHMIDMLRWYFGDFRSVSGRLTTHVDVRSGEPATAEDTFSFSAQMGGKSTGLVQFLFHAHHGLGLRLEAFGTKGTLILTDQNLMAARAGESLQEVVCPPRFEVPGVAFGENLDVRLPPFVMLIDHLARTMCGVTEQAPRHSHATFRDGVAVQLVLDAIRLSHKERRCVDLPHAGGIAQPSA